MRRRQLQLLLTVAPLVIGGLWLLPHALASFTIAGLVGSSLLLSVLWGWFSGSWRPLVLLATFTVFVDFFGLARLIPTASGLIAALLWLAGLWFVGRIGGGQPNRFDQAFASFLILELFLVLERWPVNVLSQAVIMVSFTLFLWSELIRSVPSAQRVRESIAPFLLIVALIALTAR